MFLKSLPSYLLVGSLAGLVLGLACSDDGTDPTYCDPETPCQDPSRSFCDVRGVFPESNGARNHCIVRPHASACSEVEPCPDPALPHCSVTGSCSECLNYSHCTREAPKCNLSSNVCGACDLGEKGDELCAVFDPLQPICGPDGGCVECIDSQQCPTAAAPVCDMETYACRGCQSGDECESGECDDLDRAVPAGRVTALRIYSTVGFATRPRNRICDDVVSRMANRNGRLAMKRG